MCLNLFVSLRFLCALAWSVHVLSLSLSLYVSVYVCVYIYICAMKLSQGPSLAI